MEVISTNIGNPVIVEWKGQQIQTGIYKFPVDQTIALGKEDVVNDHVINRRYHGGIDKACYLYSADHYPFWQKQYPDVKFQWGMFGENLTVSGMQESLIFIGDQFEIGSVLVQVTQPRQPCFKLGIRFNDQKVVSDFWELPYPGVYVKVLKEGQVKSGDQINLVNRNSESLSVAEVFTLFRSGINDVEKIQKAISDRNLADSCRRDLEKLLK